MIKHLMILLLLPLALLGVPEVRVVTVDRDNNVKPDGIFMSATTRTDRVWASDGVSFIDGSGVFWTVGLATNYSVSLSPVAQSVWPWPSGSGAFPFATTNTWTGTLSESTAQVIYTGDPGTPFDDRTWSASVTGTWPLNLLVSGSPYYGTCIVSRTISVVTNAVDTAARQSTLSALTNGLVTAAVTNGLASVALVQAATNGLVTAAVTNGLATASITNGLASVALVQAATNGMVKFTAQALSADQQAQARANIGAPGPYPTNIVAGFQTYDYGSNGWVRIVSSNHLLSVYEVLP